MPQIVGKFEMGVRQITTTARNKSRVVVRKPKNGKIPVQRVKPAKNAQKTRNTAKKVPIEDDECINFANWLRGRDIPFAHIANESRSSSKNAAIRGAKLKRMGQSAGVWDYEIFVPIYDVDKEIGTYQLLKLEMKRQRGGGSTTSPEQKKWGKIYESTGIPCRVCFGADEAIAFVSEYWRDPRFDDDEVF